MRSFIICRYYSPNTIKGHEITDGEMNQAESCIMHRGNDKYTVFLRRPKGKRPFRIPRRSWEDNIKTDVRETLSENVEWLKMKSNGELL
jgi:hypothetical protein